MKNKKKKKAYATLLTTYQDPAAPGSLGGVARFARAQKLPIGKVRKTLERDLGLPCTNPEDDIFLPSPSWCLVSTTSGRQISSK